MFTLLHSLWDPAIRQCYDSTLQWKTILSKLFMYFSYTHRFSLLGFIFTCCQSASSLPTLEAIWSSFVSTVWVFPSHQIKPSQHHETPSRSPAATFLQVLMCAELLSPLEWVTVPQRLCAVLCCVSYVCWFALGDLICDMCACRFCEVHCGWLQELNVKQGMACLNGEGLGTLRPVSSLVSGMTMSFIWVYLFIWVCVLGYLPSFSKTQCLL